VRLLQRFRRCQNVYHTSALLVCEPEAADDPFDHAEVDRVESRANGLHVSAAESDGAVSHVVLPLPNLNR